MAVVTRWSLLTSRRLRNDYVRQLIGDYSYWFCEAFNIALVEGKRQEIHLGGASRCRYRSCRSRLSWCARRVRGLVPRLRGRDCDDAPAAPLVLVIAAGLGMALGYFLGNGLGIILRALQLGPQGPRLGGLFGSLVGAAAGAVLGALLFAFAGTGLGSIAGFIIGKTLGKWGVRWPGSLWGTILGAGLGGVALACFVDVQWAAIGLLSGAGIGAALAVVLVLLFFVFVGAVRGARG